VDRGVAHAADWLAGGAARGQILFGLQYVWASRPGPALSATGTSNTFSFSFLRWSLFSAASCCFLLTNHICVPFFLSIMCAGKIVKHI
jgi:hypothetical protein